MNIDISTKHPELECIGVQFKVAEECFGHAKDLSGFLLLHSALGDAKGLTKLAVSAKEQGKINVAFISLFLLGKVEDCVQLLIDRYVYALLRVTQRNHALLAVFTCQCAFDMVICEYIVETVF